MDASYGFPSTPAGRCCVPPVHAGGLRVNRGNVYLLDSHHRSGGNVLRLPASVPAVHFSRGARFPEMASHRRVPRGRQKTPAERHHMNLCPLVLRMQMSTQSSWFSAFVALLSVRPVTVPFQVTFHLEFPRRIPAAHVTEFSIDRTLRPPRPIVAAQAPEDPGV